MNANSRHRARPGRTTRRGPTGASRRPGAGLGGTASRGAFILASLLLATPIGSAADEDTEPAKPAPIGAELNRADTVDAGCRLSFVIRNTTPHHFSSLQWDLVSFDAEGLIAARMAAEIAPLRANKTSVKQFDIQDFDCARIARLLLNDVTQCETEDAEQGSQARADCLGLVELSSRTQIELFK